MSPLRWPQLEPMQLRHSSTALIALASCWLLTAATATETSEQTIPKFPVHPRLLLNRTGVAALKARIVEASWAKASWNQLEESARDSLEKPVNLPPRGGNWSHNYVCPTHGARLSQGRKLEPWKWEHLCPVGRHVLQGDPTKANLDFDGNAIAGIHGDYAQEVVNDGLVFQVTGQTRFANRARDILLAYADRYRTYPLHDNQGKAGAGGRVASQSLTEASWLIGIAQGADLVWQTLSEDDRKKIEQKLLRPALEEVILPRKRGIHNIQCRHNSAIGLVGFLLGDAKLISIAIDDPANGFKRQLDKGVMEDGMWLEGSSGYHFFTISGLWPLAEAARNCGVELYSEKFRRMFEGPLGLAMPNLVLPNFNDSGTVPLRGQADLYELAFARFGDNGFVPLIHEGGRRSRLALLFGQSKLPTGEVTARSSSRNLPASGYAILAQGRGEDATWLCVKYGPHGGGHGHPDKNSFVLYSRGEIIATDAGTHAYSSPLHRDWDKTTLAHNTLIMDETSQAPATGKSIAFGSDRKVDYSVTDAGSIYPGVSFIRTVALINPNLILFVDQIDAAAAHTFDLAYHQTGEWTKSSLDQAVQGARPWPSPRTPGYVRLTQTSSRVIAGENLSLTTKLTESLNPIITIAATSPTEIIAGYGILKTTEDLAPVLIQRRTTRQTAYIWAIALDGMAPTLRISAATSSEGKILPLSKAVLVEVLMGKSENSVCVNPHALRVTATLQDGFGIKTHKIFSAY